MNPMERNFFKPPVLTSMTQVVQALNARHQMFFALRSLPGVCLDAIPGRFSSSSLPPLFVLGRFAGFSSIAGRVPLDRAEV